MCQERNVKPKLPRKRKKEMIKKQGRESYLSTVRLARVTGESPCKFWVNTSLEYVTEFIGDAPFVSQRPTRYW